MTTRKYVIQVVVIICLTNIPALLLIPTNFKGAYSWFFGSIGSAANFFWMYLAAASAFGPIAKSAQVKTVKAFYFRYLFLIVYALIVVKLLNADILIFGLALLTAQGVIFVKSLIESIIADRFTNK
ncbi:MAG: hypothetical protein P9L91_06530 [Candidatus Zophobacter franzmannii]|nr:hypothetical protein [Candidatus Zophobacter franzmannii]